MTLYMPQRITDYRTKGQVALIQSVSTKATERLVRLLESYDNRVSPDQTERLVSIVGRMAILASGQGNGGRFVFDMACGRGKTTSIRAFIGELFRQNVVDAPLIVASSRVEQLCDLKRDLIAEGVPEKEIGLYHSYDYDPSISKKVLSGEITRPDNLATEPASTRHPAHFRVVLLTHRRVKTGKGEDGSIPTNMRDIAGPYDGNPTISEAMFYAHEGVLMKRNLLIWDEGLISSKSRTVELSKLKGEFEVMTTSLTHDKGGNAATLEAMSVATEWIEECVRVIEHEQSRQRDKHLAPKGVDLPVLKAEHRNMLNKLFAGQWRDRSTIAPIHLTFPASLELVRMSAFRLRLVLTQTAQAILRYDIELPSVCDRIVVLDGSYQIRTLEKIDPELKDGYQADHRKPQASERYDRVTLHRAKMNAGRSGLKERVDSGQYAELLASFLKEKVGPDEGCLIFLYKDRDKKAGRFESTVRQQLQDLGIDLQEKIMTRDGERLRFPILTWGLETATNSYSYCKHVLLPGIYHLPEHVAASMLIAQKRDLLSPVTSPEVRDVIESEAFTAAHQAVMRVVRQWDGDQAHERHLWVFYPSDRIEKVLSGIMPGLKIEAWELPDADIPQYVKLAADIMSFMDTVGDQKISFKSMLNQFPDYSDRVKRDAMDIVKSDIVGWKVEGRSFVKTIVFGDETVTLPEAA